MRLKCPVGGGPVAISVKQDVFIQRLPTGRAGGRAEILSHGVTIPVMNQGQIAGSLCEPSLKGPRSGCQAKTLHPIGLPFGTHPSGGYQPFLKPTDGTVRFR